MEQYGYDELNRLTSVDYGDGQTQSYAFDSMGNRTSKTDAGGGMGGTEAYAYNNANMLLSRAGNPYLNDANGNTLQGGGRTNTWDSQNRLVKCVNTNAVGLVNTSQFTYACDGLRHRSVLNGGTATDFVLDNSMFVREMSGGSVKATYFMGQSGPAYRRDDVAGTLRWYLYDGLGSVLGEVDPQGNITARRKYDVYGLARSVTGMPTSKHAFVGSLGHDSEDETGLIYMQARYYDPQAGRFASQDSAGDGNNWFIYCYNNPINSVDADGCKGSLWNTLISGFTVPFLLGGIAVVMMGYGASTENPYLFYCGIVVLLLDVALALSMTASLAEKAARPIKDRRDREYQEDDAVNTFKSMGSGPNGFMYAMIGWSLEQNFALYEMGVE